MTSTVDYRDILRRELRNRCERNLRYSLRAFARDLSLSPASLSLVLNGKQGLSVAASTKIAERIGLSGVERQFFCDLVLVEHSKSAKLKSEARLRLNRSSDGAIVQLDVFAVMSGWYHLAILELTSVEGFKSSPKWIAKKFGLELSVVNDAISRLKRLNLLEERDGVLRQTVGFMATPSDIPSEAIRGFHQQILERAKTAVEVQPVSQRDFSAIILPIARKDIESAKVEIREFRRSLMEKLERAPKKDSVYCLAVQLFGLEQTGPNAL